jgi:hypothetical protein
MRRTTLRLAIAGALGLTMAAPAFAAGGNGQNGGKQTGLFPPNQPAPMTSTEASGNSADASLQHPGAAPNAGNIGANGSAGTRTGWAPQAYKTTQRSRR